MRFGRPCRSAPRQAPALPGRAVDALSFAHPPDLPSRRPGLLVPGWRIVPSEQHPKGREDDECAIAVGPLVVAGRDMAGLLRSVHQPLNAVALAVLCGLVEGQRIS